MRKLLVFGIAAAIAVAAPASAEKPENPGSKGKAKSEERSSKSKGKGKSKRCEPRKVGYKAKGTLVSHELVQTAGADTADDTSDDRYSGPVTVNVTKANHKGAKGEQTYTVENARVKFFDANGDGTADAPAAGDRTKIYGKTTKLRKKCDSEGFEPALTVRKVAFKGAPDKSEEEKTEETSGS